MSHTKVNNRHLTTELKRIPSNGKCQKILTKVMIFLKVIIEICLVLGTIVSIYELWLVKFVDLQVRPATSTRVPFDHYSLEVCMADVFL